jgi:O-antigen/teichoic acid export membrane protein
VQKYCKGRCISTPKPHPGLAKSTLANWSGQLVLLVTGFILPRMINHRMGQEALGIWDFGWSLVNSMTLVPGGIASGVNRYIARYRLENNIDQINRMVSSVAYMMRAMALIIIALSLMFAWLLSTVWKNRVGIHVEDAQWVVIFLGFSFAVNVSFQVVTGIITGHHRWDLHNAISAGESIVTTTIMVVLLYAGCRQLRYLALTYLCCGLVERLVRVYVAKRLFPDLKIRFRYASWKTARTMLKFGSKTLISTIANLLLNHGTRIVLLSALGPASVAMYARMQALLRAVFTTVTKFSVTFRPIASSLQKAGETEQLKELLIKAVRYGAYIAVPAVVTLAIMGNFIIRVWMGKHYATGNVFIVLAVGYLTYFVQQPLISIMSGMDKHGRPGIATLIAAATALGIISLVIAWIRHVGLFGFSVLLVIPLTLATGIYTPIRACKYLGIPLRHFYQRVWVGPLLCSIPFGVLLFIIRITFAKTKLLALGLGGLSGLVVLGPLYWYFALSLSLKQKILQRLHFANYHSAG